MSTAYTEKVIWDLTVELTFDCFNLCQSFPVPQKNQIAIRAKEAAAAVAVNIRAGLKCVGNQKPWFENALFFMNDLQNQLKVADFLGFTRENSTGGISELMEAVRRLLA